MRCLIHNNLQGLSKNITKYLIKCLDNLKDTRIGTAPTVFTQILWVKMIRHHFTEDKTLKSILIQTGKFNQELEKIANAEDFMHILDLQNVDERIYFDDLGQLTARGKSQFWDDLNIQFKLFDRAAQPSSFQRPLQTSQTTNSFNSKK